MGKNVFAFLDELDHFEAIKKYYLCFTFQVKKIINEQRRKGVNVVTYIECSAIEHTNLKNIFDEAIKTAMFGTSIHRAARRGFLTDKVKQLLDHGAKINQKDKDSKTPIHYAAEKGRTDLVKLLLDHRPNIDEHDRDGVTPIHRAAMNGHTDTLKLLLDHGANIDLKNSDGQTPIYREAGQGHTDTVKCLLAAGADPFIADDDGQTARDIDRTG